MEYQAKTQAGQELQRIEGMTAFNVSTKNLHEAKKLNQHATQYRFFDASILWIYTTTQKGWAYKIGVESIQKPLKINR